MRTVPEYLLADDITGERFFLIHTAAPAYVAEIFVEEYTLDHPVVFDFEIEAAFAEDVGEFARRTHRAFHVVAQKVL